MNERTDSQPGILQEIEVAKQTLYQSYKDTLYRLSVAAELKDKDTAFHIDRVSRFCILLAEASGMSPDEVEIISFASPMHDVGKIGIPDRILLKPGPLEPEEWETMKQHTVFGSRLLCDSNSDLLKAGEIIAQSHHEKWDGSGYPDGLAGEDIPQVARIAAIADSYDAMTNARPYQESLSNDHVLELMEEERGLHFDPDLLDTFIQHIDEVAAIQKEFPI